LRWIATPEKDTATVALEKRLWDAADQFRANSGLKAQEYSGPILGLIFLRFAEVRFAAQRTKLDKVGTSSRRGSRLDEPAAYHAEGVLYLEPQARFDFLLTLPEAADIGAKVNAAMRNIEKYNPQLAGVLPKTYNLFAGTLLKELLKKVSEIPASVDFDAFGRIYEYFLGEFARTEGQKGGEFYTPASIVRLLAEIIEPFHGRILDPACGSGGMFVQSARFVAEHQKNPAAELAICGVEKTGRMPLAARHASLGRRAHAYPCPSVQPHSGKADRPTLVLRPHIRSVATVAVIAARTLVWVKRAIHRFPVERLPARRAPIDVYRAIVARRRKCAGARRGPRLPPGAFDAARPSES
jgi:hypothetical protein